MKDVVREIAERLRSVDEMRRFAEASSLSLIAEMAESYEVEYDEVLEVLVERKIVVGGVGTPCVSEFLALELAGLLRCTPIAAAGRLADAINLKHRHPRMFAAMVEMEIEAARACKAAAICADLPPEKADEVASRWVSRQGALGWTAAMNLLKKMVLEADPARAAERERQAREDRGVHVWGLYQGVMNLTGRLDVLDARYLDAAVERVAEILAVEEPEAATSVLRAKALGVLANPAYALALLQRAAQPALLDGESPAGQGFGVAACVPDPSAEDRAEVAGQRHDPHCLGALCGTITTPLSKLRPRLELAVHLHADAVGHLSGTARVEKAGHITTSLLADLLPGLDVSVQPVIDLAEVPAEDRYVASVGLRRALLLTMNHEMFPYSARHARGLDLDHTDPFVPGCRGQTRVGNLGPFSRRVHRAKTGRYWRVQQPRAGQFYWFSPLGYRYEVTASGTRMLA